MIEVEAAFGNVPRAAILYALIKRLRYIELLWKTEMDFE